VKLVVEEAESSALAAALVQTDQVTSVLAGVEVGRQARRADPDAPRRAANVLARLALRPVDAAVVDRAIALEPLGLRALDAVHVATALSLGDRLAALCTYDLRMEQAADLVALRVLAPTP